jgi:tetratricopeptide (TPR) repeat protein
MADWLRLAEEFYHQRNYERTLELAMVAHKAAPGVDPLTWIIKARVKLGDYATAIEEIDQLRALGQVRDAYFLRGFLERTRGRYPQAIRYYEEARKAGRGGLAIERDLAECYYQVGDLVRASERIEEAQKRQVDNPYVVSLRVKIACRQGDEETARALLTILDQVDDPAFAAHRRSRVELTFGDVELAYNAAIAATSSSSRPPAEALSNLALCQLRTNRISDAAETTTRLEKLYRKQRADIVTGLRARIALAEGRYDDAIGYCEEIVSRDNPVHLALRRDSLRGLAEHTSLASRRRREVLDEVAALEARLTREYGGREFELAQTD